MCKKNRQALRKLRSEYLKSAKKNKDPIGHPSIKMFGVMVEFHASTPRQFFRSCVMAVRLGNLARETSREIEKLEAQLKKIQELHSQLSGEETTS